VLQAATMEKSQARRKPIIHSQKHYLEMASMSDSEGLIGFAPLIDTLKERFAPVLPKIRQVGNLFNRFTGHKR